jgi:hypothetical protein
MHCDVVQDCPDIEHWFSISFPNKMVKILYLAGQAFSKISGLAP